jgi:histidinol phosphatase-like enzyme
LPKLTFCFDLDGTICTQEPDNINPYNKAKPYSEIIEKINELYDEGYIIKIFTARGTRTGVDWKEFTLKQLKEWGIKYHDLILGKPHADIFIDDKSISPDDFCHNLTRLKKELIRSHEFIYGKSE